MENEAGEKCLQVRACVRAERCDILLFVVGGREKTAFGADFSRLETATFLGWKEVERAAPFSGAPPRSLLSGL